MSKVDEESRRSAARIIAYIKHFDLQSGIRVSVTLPSGWTAKEISRVLDWLDDNALLWFLKDVGEGKQVLVCWQRTQE